MRTRSHRQRLDNEPVPSAREASLKTGPAFNPTLHPLATSLLELQHLAGNRAVASSVGSWRNGRVVIGASNVDVKTHPSAPPDGIRKIAESRGTGGGLLGRTVASIDPSPPLLRADAPVKVDHGWTAQAKPVRVPEPYLESWWPTTGLHEEHPHVFLDVSSEWEGRIKAGEEEHIGDHTVGWRVTWGKVAELIGELAGAPGPAQPTEDAARQDLWKRFRAALPADLRPAGAEPTDEAQKAAWGFDEATSLFKRLFTATAARDHRGWHTTTSELDHLNGKDEIRVVGGTTHIGETSPEDLIAEKRAGAAGH